MSRRGVEERNCMLRLQGKSIHLHFKQKPESALLLNRNDKMLRLWRYARNPSILKFETKKKSRPYYWIGTITNIRKDTHQEKMNKTNLYNEICNPVLAVCYISLARLYNSHYLESECFCRGEDKLDTLLN